MHYSYKLSNGHKAFVDYYGDLGCTSEDIALCASEYLKISERYGDPQEGESMYKDIGRAAKKKVRSDNDGKYFMWNGEHIYLNNYEHYKIDELSKQKDLCDSDVIQAILKHGINKTGFMANMRVATSVIPGFGMLLSSDEVRVLCKIREDRHKVAECYKIELVPDREDLLTVVPGRSIYLSSITGFIKCGMMEPVDLETARKQELESRLKAEEKKRSVWGRLKNLIRSASRV